MQKHVLIIGLSPLVGGIETYLMNLLEYSDKNRISYDYLIIGEEKPAFYEKIQSFYQDNHIFYVKNMKKNPLYVIKELTKIYKNKKYDFVYLNTCSTTKIIYCIPYIFFNKTKLITHSHNSNGKVTFFNYLFMPLVNLLSYKKLACSNVAAIWLFGKRNEKKVKIINNAIDTEKFRFKLNYRNEIREKYHLNSKQIVFGHVGRFMEQKNHQYLIDIFYDFIKTKNKDAMLLLVGTGENENLIKNKVKQLKIEKNVIFVGLQKETYKYYSAMDIFLLPSLYEGLPIVGIEAQCSGLKCIFSDNITHNLQLNNNCSFIKIKDENKSDWVEEMSRTISFDREEAYKILIDKKYDVISTVKEIENIFKGVSK